MRTKQPGTPRPRRETSVEITPSIPGDRQVIAGYGPKLFRISGLIYETSVLVFTDRTVAWPVAAFEDVMVENFADVQATTPPVEVLLLGVGERNLPVPIALRDGLRQAGIVLEAMDTGAACRTFNVLMAEDRRVAAALIALS